MNHYLQLSALVWLVFFCGCTPPQEKQINGNDFFHNPKYPDSDYFKTLPMSNIDSCIKHIREEVPPQYQEWACESLYFQLPDSTSYKTIFRYLDLVEQNFPEGHIFCQHIRGRLFTKMAQYDTAYTCLQDGYQQARINKDTLRAADSQFELAKWASNRGDYPESIRYLLEVNKVYQQIPTQDGRYFEVLIALGNTYKTFQDLEMSQYWFQKAWVYAHRYEKQKGFKIVSATRIADVYLLKNQLDSAQIFLDTAFYFQNYYKNDYDQDINYWIQARIDLALNNCPKALINIDKAILLIANKEDTSRIKRYETSKADAYNCLGQWDKAISYYKSSLNTTDSVTQQNVLDKLSQLYQKQNKPELAMQHKLQSEELEKRLFDKKKSKEIAILESKDEWIKREQAVKQQIKEKENTKNSLGISLVLALIGLTVIGILLNTRHKRIKHLEKVRKNIEQENKRKTNDLEQIQKDMHVQSSALEKMAQLLELKNILINELEEKATASDNATMTSPNDMGLQLRKMNLLTADDWKRFYDLFEQSFPNFQARLKSNFPSLSPAEIRLFILLKLKLDNTEIAETLAISIDSVYKSRYRLRKKLGFTNEIDWESFIFEF